MATTATPNRVRVAGGQQGQIVNIPLGIPSTPPGASEPTKIIFPRIATNTLKQVSAVPAPGAGR